MIMIKYVKKKKKKVRNKIFVYITDKTCVICIIGKKN